MIPLSIADIAEITGGSLDCVSDPDQRVTGFIEFDSRKVTKGGLFLALPGARVDGHDYAEKAIEQGAVAVLAARLVARFGEPIDTADYDESAAEDPMVTFELTDHVRETIQQTLYRLLAKRRNVFLG